MVITRGAKGRPMADPEAPMMDKFEKQRQEESRLVKGIFQDNEVQGGHIDFVFRKWKGDPLKTYHLVDGMEYELPLSVVKHLNSGCYTEEHSYILGPDGQPTKSGKKHYRFAFKVSEYN